MFRALVVFLAVTCSAAAIVAQPMPDFSSDTPVLTTEPVEEEPIAEPEPVVEEPAVEEPVAEPTNEDNQPAEDEDESEDESVSGGSEPVSKCLASKIRYVESASRKLHRALGSKGYKMKAVGLQPQIVVDSVGGDGAATFKAYPIEDGSVVGVLSDRAKRSYIVANTSRGHIITTIQWGGCPKNTYIAYPAVENTNVDLEPFKYWGFRVLWALPKKLGKKDATKSLAEVIRRGK